MGENTRVSGHTLWHEGMALAAAECQTGPCMNRRGGLGRNGVYGEGHACCSCGAVSPHLSSGAERKRWHREHKAEVRRG